MRLDWPVDTSGYTIEPARPGSGDTLLGSVGGSALIVPRGGKLEWRDAFAVDGLWRRLADTEPSEAGALTFVSAFGLLTPNPRQPRQCDPIDAVCRHIEVMRSVCAAIEARDWGSLDYWLLDARRGIRLHPEFQFSDSWRRPALFFSPDRLIDAIYLQALQDAVSQAEHRQCDRPGCGAYVAVGPGTGRPRTNRGAFYCSPKCQKSHQYRVYKEQGRR